MSDLDEILNGSDAEPAPAPEAPAEPAQPASPEVAPKAPAAPAAGQPRDEHGQFAPKGEPSAEAPAGATPAPTDTVPLAALIAERTKRQDAERELALRPAAAPVAAAPAAPAAPSAPPDRYEDPEGYDRWLIESVQSRAISAARVVVENDRIATSADAAIAKYPDYADMAEVFLRLSAQNPALEQALRQNRNPAEYAYQTAKMHLELQQHGSLAALIAAREAAAVEKAKAELVKAGHTPASPQLPESLAAASSARSSAAAPAGPPSLDEILNPAR